MPISATIRGVLATSAALLGFAAAIPVQAQTAVDPGDYTALPPGTDLAVVYGQFINRDKLKLQDLEQRLKEDQQRLGELKRVESERGGSSEAVKLIFPPAGS